MRRLSGVALLAVVSVLATSFVATAAGNSYADSFPSATFDNSTGSLSWTAPWVEVGENDGPSSGNVRAVTSGACDGFACLRFDAPVLKLLNDIGARRTVDLTPAESAQLSYEFDWAASTLPILPPIGTLVVEARPVTGGSWTPLRRHPSSNSGQGTVEISEPLIGRWIEVRFILETGSVNARVFLDNVSVDLIYPAPTKPSTTTTTSPPTTTTTKPPLITLPSTPPLFPTTTTTEPRPTTSTTEAPTTTTTISDDRDTTTTSSVPRSTTTSTTTSTTVVAAENDPTPPDLAAAEASGVVLDLSPAGTAVFERTFGLSPLTSLNASFRSVVEAIQSEVVSALALGLVVAFFAVRLPKDPEELEDDGPEAAENDA